MKSLQLPSELCAAAEKRYVPAFGSLEELLVFILKALVNEDAINSDQADRQMIEERLRDLGYL